MAARERELSFTNSKMTSRILSIKLILTALMVVSAVSAVAGDGLTYKSKDGRLTVWVPVAPQVSEQSMPSNTGGPYKRTTIAAEARPSLYLAGILDFRRDLATTGDEASYLDTMLRSMTAGFGNSFDLDKNEGSKNLVSTTGQKGRQIKGTVQGQRVLIRAFVGKYRIYMQQVVFPVEYAGEVKNAERFFDSLTIAD